MWWLKIFLLVTQKKWTTIEMFLGKNIFKSVVRSMVEIKWSSIRWLKNFGHQQKTFLGNNRRKNFRWQPKIFSHMNWWPKIDDSFFWVMTKFFWATIKKNSNCYINGGDWTKVNRMNNNFWVVLETFLSIDQKQIGWQFGDQKLATGNFQLPNSMTKNLGNQKHLVIRIDLTKIWSPKKLLKIHLDEWNQHV